MTKIKLEPKLKPAQIETVSVNWQERGESALAQVFEGLRIPSVNLGRASQQYLTDTSGFFSDSVETHYEVATGNYESFRDAAARDGAILKLYETATDLHTKIGEKLDTIRQLTRFSHVLSSPLNEIQDAVKQRLQSLLVSDDPQHIFERKARELLETTQQAISLVRNGVTDGTQVSEQITGITRTKKDEFDEWWTQNHKPHYSDLDQFLDKLGQFADHSEQKGSSYRDELEHVGNGVNDSTVDPVDTFISEYRAARFPSE